MGNAGWELRYHLCRTNLTVHYLRLPGGLRFPYYSNGGPIDEPVNGSSTWVGRAELAVVVQHGANRNADDYFCAGTEAARLAGYGDGRALVLAPRFMEPADHPTTGTVWWNGSFPDGCWRCGAESDPASSADGTTTVSSYAVLDTIVRLLQAAKAARRFPRLRRVTLAGHSSGGQMIQRHAIFSRIPPVSARAPSSTRAMGMAPPQLQVRHVPGNPSSSLTFRPNAGLSSRPAPDASWFPVPPPALIAQLMTHGTSASRRGSCHLRVIRREASRPQSNGSHSERWSICKVATTPARATQAMKAASASHMVWKLAAPTSSWANIDFRGGSCTTHTCKQITGGPCTRCLRYQT